MSFVIWFKAQSFGPSIKNTQNPSGIVAIKVKKSLTSRHFVQFCRLIRELEILDPESALGNFWPQNVAE